MSVSAFMVSLPSLGRVCWGAVAMCGFRPKTWSGKTAIGVNVVAAVEVAIHTDLGESVVWIAEKDVPDLLVERCWKLAMLEAGFCEKEPKKQRKQPTAVRIMAHYGANCHWCGRVLTLGAEGDAMPTVEHLIPRSKGGTNRLSNLRPACAGCNHRRGDRLGPPPGSPS